MKKGAAGKKELQAELKSQEDWDGYVSTEKPGLFVVDVYAAWCGPCKAIVNTFRKIKNESGDDVNFAIAECDKIETLMLYRGKSRPTFLFYGDGMLINVVRGCNGPLLIRSIEQAIKHEKDIAEGSREREEFKDVEVISKGSLDDMMFQDDEGEEGDAEIKKTEEEEEEEELVDVEKEVTVAIIKPDAVEAGLVDEIIAQIEASGMEILAKEERTLTTEEAMEFYKQHEGSEHFEDLISFMSSGPCMTLVLAKKGETAGIGLINEFRDLIGPKEVEDAKENAPESLRAKFGQDTVHNAMHGCDTTENAVRELAFFFPDFNRPTIPTMQKKKRLQRTLALIRPKALAQNREAIIKNISEAGFCIAMEKEVTLTREQAEHFYTEHRDQPYFEALINSMTSGPSLALCLAREDAVEKWREMLGPKKVSVAQEEAPESLRAQFADPDADPEDVEINAIHGADSETRVVEEMNILFPMQNTMAVIKPEVEEDEREKIMEKIKAAGFKIAAQKEVHLTKDLAEMFYSEHNGKEFYGGLTDYMSSGPSQFLILSREDAVSGFRALLGPTNPEEAKESQPESLRAQFGKSTDKNAVHGSSNLEKAKSLIMEHFPDLTFKEDGTVKSPSPPPSATGQTAEAEAEAAAAEGGGTAEVVTAEVTEGGGADATTAETTAEGATVDGATAETVAEGGAVETGEATNAETSAEGTAESSAEAVEGSPAETAVVEGEAPVETSDAAAADGEAGEGAAETAPAETAESVTAVGEETAADEGGEAVGAEAPAEAAADDSAETTANTTADTTAETTTEVADDTPAETTTEVADDTPAEGTSEAAADSEVPVDADAAASTEASEEPTAADEDAAPPATAEEPVAAEGDSTLAASEPVADDAPAAAAEEESKSAE